MATPLIMFWLASILSSMGSYSEITMKWASPKYQDIFFKEFGWVFTLAKQSIASESLCKQTSIQTMINLKCYCSQFLFFSFFLSQNNPFIKLKQAQLSQLRCPHLFIYPRSRSLRSICLFSAFSAVVSSNKLTQASPPSDWLNTPYPSNQQLEELENR